MNPNTQQMSTTAIRGFISNAFPDGLRVLAVDDDSTCLLVLEKMLQTCNYEVTKCKRALDALSILREGRKKFDLVISDIHMPPMDGFRFLEIISLEMDLPVVMTSSDDQKDAVMRVIIQGACDYLVKPDRLEVIQFLWQRVVRKRNNIGLKALERSENVQRDKMKYNQSNKKTSAPFENKENGGKNHEGEEGINKDGTVSIKKSRMVWTDELRQQFATIVNHIGLKNAVSKKILELMNVLGLTRENVASHLRKYRLHLQKQNEKLQNGTKYNSPQMHNQYMNLKRKFSINSCNFQSHATASSLSRQSLTAELVDFERSNKVFSSGMDMVEEKNFCDYGMIESTNEMVQQSRLSAMTASDHPVLNFANTNMQVTALISNVQPLQTSLGINSFVNSNNSLYGIQSGLSTMQNIQNPSKIQRLNENTRSGAGGVIIDSPIGHAANLYEHTFSLGNPNATFMCSNNLEFCLDSSSYEAALLSKGFDQDNFDVRPLDKYYAGSVQLRSTFGGYPADSSFI